MSPKTIPPTKPPSGAVDEHDQPAGPRLYVFGCGDCSKPYLGYLRKFLPDGIKLMEADDDRAARQAADYVGIRAIDGDRWYPESAPEAANIVKTARTKCPNGALSVACNPRTADDIPAFGK